MKRLLTLFAAALLAAACGNVATEPEDKSPDGTGGYSASKPCGDANKCPTGQFCYNGLCALGCNSNGDCAADQYCDTEWSRLCQNKVVKSCPDTPCPEAQTCVQSLCTAKEQPKQTCNPDSFNDGCAENAFCIEEDENQDPQCMTFSACGEDGTCPAGLFGALCNENLITNKARVCLPGLCKEAGNCPANWVCVKMTSTDPVGFCSNGGLSSMCTKPEECVSPFICQQPMPGMAGVCAPDDGF
ncbi:MAG TPA: hypothetical protein DFS52_11545 [Myxococcales bacterium]|jgi:hypothetical protein|nr:hypothetical protein [Myxococcales bacterium]